MARTRRFEYIPRTVRRLLALFLLTACTREEPPGVGVAAAAPPSAAPVEPTKPAEAQAPIASAKVAEGAAPKATEAAAPAEGVKGDDPPLGWTKVVPPATFPAKGSRIYAKSRYVWVHYEPNPQSGWLGFLWLGGHADVERGPLPGGPGCIAWYQVKPKGFVCVDDKIATLDPEDPELVALRPFAPNMASPWPHRYAESRGVQRYRAIPARDAARQREWDLDEHEARIKKAASGELHPSLVGVDLAPGPKELLPLPGTMPATLREERRRLLPNSTFAYTGEQEVDGRTWLLSADFVWAPKDRVAPYPVSGFHGVDLRGGKEKLPLAFFRGKARPKYRLEGDGFVATGEEHARLSHVALTGEERGSGKERYWKTADGSWVKDTEAVVVKLRETPPSGVKGARKTWIDASILGGWLVAYEGAEPIYATLISPGRGGLPERGRDPLETASTPVGPFVITGKFATATMVAPGDFIHSDVPWAQNFHGPHAIHTAYWHDNWGEKMSAGCVNVSAIDGRWLFHWTDPPIPEGWHGIRYEPKEDPTTVFAIHE